MQQLTIFHQLVGQKCQFLGKSGVIVDIVSINSQPHLAVHTRFEPAQKSPFHARKWVYTALFTPNEIKF